MRHLKYIFLTALFAFSTAAQGTLPTNEFISIYGNFRLSLPENPLITRGLTPENSSPAESGMIYAWDFENVVYTAQYSEQKTALKESIRGKREVVRQNGGQIIAEKQIPADQIRAVELEARIGSGKLIARFFQAGGKSYAIEAVVRDLNDEPKARKILDSFKPIDGRMIQLRQINAATPNLLPRQPVLKFPKSDLQTANLKGKVKSVCEETADLTGTAFQQGRIFTAEFFYDVNGFLAKEIRYDPRGNPSQIAVFGFLDESLVSRIGLLKYESDPRVLEPQKTNEALFDLKIEYIFDEKNRITETSFLHPDGSLRSKTLTKYDGDKIEMRFYNSQGLIVSKIVETFDKNRTVSESVRQVFSPTVREYKTKYEYKTFDRHGNWTKRHLLEWTAADGESSYKIAKIQYRTFTYY